MGYRSFEIRNLATLFPFGYGLSYSQFTYSDLETTPISPEGKFTVSFKITNVSQIEGREVAQVYVSDKESSLPRPIKELKGFSKTMLKAGETKTVTLALDREALGFYDDREMHWVAEKGAFVVSVGASSADVKLTGDVELKESFTWTGL